eukprot:gnl/MRDRNA2_/MRDRNA2_82286_c0_seq4.p1 gnl/MRDRNA2_/MRDRNA2_82286_c0~~gnl/MRDRNA2_/MRDRNA2_82286_c0_seq4.p1  ORF type:complete len:459 (-),score=167.41 gnl/MRDRNA2_/MRDRNA2_82286_c0_seq4:137-1363(-)
MATEAKAAKQVHSAESEAAQARSAQTTAETHAAQAQAAQKGAEKKAQQEAKLLHGAEAESSTARAATVTAEAKAARAQEAQAALEKEAARAKAAAAAAEAEAAERARSADQAVAAAKRAQTAAETKASQELRWAQSAASQARTAETKEAAKAAEQIHASQIEADHAVALSNTEEAKEKEEEQRVQVADGKAAKAAKTVAHLRAQLKANGEVAGQISFGKGYLDAAVCAVLALLIGGGLLRVASRFFKKPVPKITGPQAEHEELSGALQELKKSLLEHKEDHEAEHAQRMRLEASFDVKAGDRQLVSDRIYMGEVVKVWGKCVWVKPETFSIMEISSEVEHKLVKMNEEIRAKLNNQFHNENVLYVRVSDVAQTGLVLELGVQIQFKLYTFDEGVGGCDIKAASFSRQL